MPARWSWPKLNDAKTIASGYYYNPGGNAPVSNEKKKEKKKRRQTFGECSTGSARLLVHVTRPCDYPANDAMSCQGGLYAVPAEGQAPTCAKDPDQLILIVALVALSWCFCCFLAGHFRLPTGGWKKKEKKL